jgi:shikimate kinase
MKTASNLILVGPMGAGKTSIGRRLADRLGLHFVDADVALEAITGVSIALIFEVEGEAGFRQRERSVLAELCRGSNQLIATGGGAVLDAQTRATLSQSGFVVYLRTNVERQLERLKRDRNRPLLRAPDRRERLVTLARERGPLYEEVADLTYDSEHASVALACDQLQAQIEQHWQRVDEEHAA